LAESLEQPTLGFGRNADAAAFHPKAHPCVRLGFALFGNADDYLSFLTIVAARVGRVSA
jgi:hypothetical protein